MARRSSLFCEADYVAFLDGLKEGVRRDQVRAALAGNREVVLLYWRLGREMLMQQEAEGWSPRVFEQLAQDFRREFPDIQGFSAPNLKFMRAFAQAYPQERMVQEVLAWVPWSHHVVLLKKLRSLERRLWYARMTLIYGWSHNVLAFLVFLDLFWSEKGILSFIF